MIEIIPAIDIIGGRCVRLTKGDYGTSKVYDCSPLDMALRYADCGVKRIHMVDLDGAKAGTPVNLRTLEEVASALPTATVLEWGGGISSREALQSSFDAGCGCAVIGSIAVREPSLMKEWLTAFGPERMVLGADVRDGKVAVKGWLEDSEVTVEALVESFLPDGLSQVICTDISRDGMLQGPSFEMYGELQKSYPDMIFTVSGGISAMSDIERLDGMGLGRVIVGKAIYEGKIDLKDIESWSLRG